MALRVGIDLVSIESVRRSLKDHPDGYLSRVYTEDESSDCTNEHGIDPLRLAARFAAKEAAMKVLRPADCDAIPWHCIEVVRDPSGSVRLSLSGAAATLARRGGIDELALSLSHEEDYACAVVVADCRTLAPGPRRGTIGTTGDAGSTPDL